jgi:hypothetical protein
MAHVKCSILDCTAEAEPKRSRLCLCAVHRYERKQAQTRESNSRVKKLYWLRRRLAKNARRRQAEAAKREYRRLNPPPKRLQGPDGRFIPMSPRND